MGGDTCILRTTEKVGPRRISAISLTYSNAPLTRALTGLGIRLPRRQVGSKRRDLFGRFDTGPLSGHLGSGPPCSTWSSLRFMLGGPSPVRMRGSFAWGLPNLSGVSARRVREANVLMLTFLTLCEDLWSVGGSYWMEHPGNRGKNPSIPCGTPSSISASKCAQVQCEDSWINDDLDAQVASVLVSHGLWAAWGVPACAVWRPWICQQPRSRLPVEVPVSPSRSIPGRSLLVARRAGVQGVHHEGELGVVIGCPAAERHRPFLFEFPRRRTSPPSAGVRLTQRVRVPRPNGLLARRLSCLLGPRRRWGLLGLQRCLFDAIGVPVDGPTVFGPAERRRFRDPPAGQVPEKDDRLPGGAAASSALTAEGTEGHARVSALTHVEGPVRGCGGAACCP